MLTHTAGLPATDHPGAAQVNSEATQGITHYKHAQAGQTRQFGTYSTPALMRGVQGGSSLG